MEIKLNFTRLAVSEPVDFVWLLIDSKTIEVARLMLLAFNYGDSTNECFFKQGYLSFDALQAVYIAESSSEQVALETREGNELSMPFSLAVQRWLSENIVP